MRKFVRTYSPFLVYFVCVALAYFLCFYLFPKYNAALAYLGFLIIYTYIDIGVFILGFFMGKIIVKRSMHIAKLNGRLCGAKRPHSVSEQPNFYQSLQSNPYNDSSHPSGGE